MKKFLLGNIFICFIVACVNNKEHVIQYYENGNVKKEGYIINNIREGEFIEYYPTGKVKDILHYVNGRKNGRCMHFSQKGKLLIDAVFKNDVYLHGTHYNFEEGNTSVVYGIRTNSILRMYDSKKKLYFIRIDTLGPTRQIQFYESGKLEVIGDISFLSDRDTMLLNKYYPDWRGKIMSGRWK